MCNGGNGGFWCSCVTLLCGKNKINLNVGKMSISINNDPNFKDLSITFKKGDIERVKGIVLGMRIVKIMMNSQELILYRSIYKLVDIELEGTEGDVLSYDYIFTIKDTLTDEEYCINMSYYDRVFFQNTTIVQ